MNIGTFLAKLSGHRQKREAAAVNDFGKLALLLADGKEPSSAEQAENTLRESNKTPQDLEREVARIQHRRELRKQIAAVATVAAERSKLESAMKRADADFAEAQRRYDATTAPLLQRDRELTETERAATEAQAELRRTADPERVKTLNDLIARLADMHRRMKSIAEGNLELDQRSHYLRETARVEALVDRDESPIRQRDRAINIRETEEQIAAIEMKRKQQEAELLSLKGQIAGVEQKIAMAEGALLED